MSAWGASWGSAWASSWGAIAQVHGRIVRRGKTKLWPGWQDEIREERTALDLSKAQLSILLAEQERLSTLLSARASAASGGLQRLGMVSAAARLKKDLASVRRQIQQYKRDILKSQKRIRALQEEVDILIIAGELYG